MKKHLLLGSIFLSLSIHASNPFDIAQNMQKIESEDTLLLNTLEDEFKSMPTKTKHKKTLKKQHTTAPKKEIRKQQPVSTPPKELQTKQESIKETNQVVKISSTPIEIPPKPKTEVQKVKVQKVKVQKVEVQKAKVQKIKLDMPKTIHKPIQETKIDIPVQPKKQITKQETKPAYSPLDINISKEQEEAKKKAQQELEQAIKEVDMED